MGKPLFDFEDAFDIFTPFIVLLIAFFSAKFLRIARLRLRLWRLNRRHARQEVNSGRATDGLVRLTDVTTTAPVTARPEPPRLQVRREWTPASPEVPTAPRRPAAGATAARDRRLSRLKEYAYDASAEQADGDECTICFEDFSGGERIRELPCGTIGHRASRGRRTRPHFTASFSDLRTVLSFSLSLALQATRSTWIVWTSGSFGTRRVQSAGETSSRRRGPLWRSRTGTTWGGGSGRQPRWPRRPCRPHRKIRHRHPLAVAGCNCSREHRCRSRRQPRCRARLPRLPFPRGIGSGTPCGGLSYEFFIAS